MKTLDKYVLQSLITTFISSIIIFAAILLASDAFLDIIKQVSAYGIPLKVAFLVLGLRLPGVIIYTIPVALLVSIILTYNRLNNNLEIISMKASGISLYRILLPTLAFGLFAGLFTLTLSEVIVPQANYQARNIMIWAVTQKNIPKQKNNFVFKDLDANTHLKRLFYVEKYTNNKMQGVIVLDLTQPKTTKIIQSRELISKPNKWEFFNGRVYTVSNNGKVTNTGSFEKITLEDPLKLDLSRTHIRSKELNYFELAKIISEKQAKGEKVSPILEVKWHEKIALPFTCLLIPLIGVSLAITPPRSRFNRGLGFSIIVIFLYYMLKAISTALGEAGFLPTIIAAWLPNVVILFLGIVLLQRKNHS